MCAVCWFFCCDQALSQLQDGEVQALEASESGKEKELRSENDSLRTRLSQVMWVFG